MLLDCSGWSFMNRYIHIEDLPEYVPLWVANYGSGNAFETASKDYLKEEYPDRIIRMHQFTDRLEGFGYDASIYYDD